MAWPLSLRAYDATLMFGKRRGDENGAGWQAATLKRTRRILCHCFELGIKRSCGGSDFNPLAAHRLAKNTEIFRNPNELHDDFFEQPTSGNRSSTIQAQLKKCDSVPCSSANSLWCAITQMPCLQRGLVPLRLFKKTLLRTEWPNIIFQTSCKGGTG